MASLQFGEWAWHYASQSTEILEHLQNELVSDGWLFRQPAKEQVKILTGAPEEFVHSILKQIKPECAIELGLNPFK